MRHARILAEAVANTKVKIDLSSVQTNIVIFDVSPLGMKAAEFIDELKGSNIKASEYGKYLVRLVTHKDVSRADIDYAVERAREAVQPAEDVADARIAGHDLCGAAHRCGVPEVRA